MKLPIKNIYGEVLFEHEEKYNTMGKTVESAAESGIDL